MFAAYLCLRPAAGALEPPQRLRLWRGFLRRFFLWVWASAILLVATGYWMLVTHFGGFAGAPPYVDIMQALGWLMILLFVLLFHGPWLKFKRAVDAEDWPAAAVQPQPHPHHHRDQPAARPDRGGGRRHREVLGVLGVDPLVLSASAGPGIS